MPESLKLLFWRLFFVLIILAQKMIFPLIIVFDLTEKTTLYTLIFITIFINIIIKLNTAFHTE